MNYCHACRRHLNGALACAGCGTPAEYLMPAAPVAAQAAPVAPAPEPPPVLADVFADSLVVLSAPNERRPGARRRATHRRRRRTVLTIGLGLAVALGGSLAVAHIATDGQRTDRAATVVLTDDGPQQPAPLPDAPTAGAPTGSGKATTKAAPASTKKSGSGAPSGDVTQPGPSPSAPAPATSGPASGTPGPGGSVQPSTSGRPSQSVTGTAQTPPPPVPPKPTPTPSKDCGFLGMLCWAD
ncbi:hypothetical protein [Streptomyces sp. 147326]|uniref:SCO2400 family protein n=1 Tax=Streptomyces sp. 147326 TaxID=3074379 RepID=UPI003857C47C